MQIDLTGWPHFNPTVAAAARKRINMWTAKHTAGKITAVLPDSLPDPSTRLILVDALSFKGLWATAFDTNKTKEAAFHISPDKSVSVPMMHMQGNFPFLANGEMEGLELPYVSNRCSMLILLPLKGHSLSELEKALTISQIRQWGQTDHPSEVDIALPKFTQASSCGLKKALTAMGMSDAFSSDSANFTGITPSKPFFLEAAIQKVCLSVDERGTAATAFFEANSLDLSFFDADHPFIYLIRDNLTGAILFMGRVVDPSKDD